jgi:SAM-dependent methyltransferase
MNEVDKKQLESRYLERLSRDGAVAAALGEPKRRQNYYFHFLLDAPQFAACDSILDVGCGYGDLATFLRGRGWEGRYVGIDVVPALIEAGRAKHPGTDLRVLDIESEPLDEKFDWVTCIGALSGNTTEVDHLAHLGSMLRAMWSKCRRGISFNLLSPYVDFKSPVHAHPPIGAIIDLVHDLSRRFVLRNDYMPFEYALHILRDDAVDRELSIFAENRPLFDRLCR